jgi:hypothetical protein
MDFRGGIRRRGDMINVNVALETDQFAASLPCYSRFDVITPSCE